jgi:hypothetical protein
MLFNVLLHAVGDEVGDWQTIGAALTDCSG